MASDPSSLIFAGTLGLLAGWLLGRRARGSAPHPPAPLSPDDDLVETVLVPLLRQGRKIEAIRELRRRTGAGLREAKLTVDSLERGDAASRLGVHRGGGVPGGS